jgi:hypothetical protein
MLRHAFLLLWLTPILVACGATGENGTAVFMVGSSWQPAVPIAAGSVFAISAHRSDLFQTSLTVESDTPTVIAPKGGAFEALAAGAAVIKAMDPSSNAEVDRIGYTVAKTATAGLAYWPDVLLTPTARVAPEFAVLAGAQVPLRARLADALQRELNHQAVASLAAAATATTAVSIAPDAEQRMFQLTAATLPAEATLTFAVARGSEAALTATHTVHVVDLAAVAKLEIGKTQVQIQAEGTPGSDTAQGAPDVQAGKRLYFVRIVATTAQGLRIYGVPATWTVTAGTAQLGTTTPSEFQYFELSNGQAVTLQATAGGQSAEITIAY